MFELTITPEANKQLKKLKSKFRKEAISEVLEEIKHDPFIGKPLSDELSGKYSYKMGVYRIIYKIDTEDKVVTIISAGHRGIIYKK